MTPAAARRSPSVDRMVAIDLAVSSITHHPDRGWVTVYSSRAVRQARGRCPGSITPSSAQSSSTARRNSGYGQADRGGVRGQRVPGAEPAAVPGQHLVERAPLVDAA